MEEINQPIQATTFLKQQFVELKKDYNSSVTSIFDVKINSGPVDPHYKAHLESLLSEIKKYDCLEKDGFDEPFETIYANIYSLKILIFCGHEYPFKPPKIRIIDSSRPKSKFTAYHPNIINGKMDFPLIGEKWCPAITLKDIVAEVIKILCDVSSINPALKKEYFTSCIKYALESHEMAKKSMPNYIDKSF